jgi:glucosyl-3-phosphoglycerate synthase
MAILGTVVSAVRTFHHADFPIERLARERRERVSVVVPTRECAKTIGTIAEMLVELRAQGVIDQVIVVDADSVDGTARIAAAAGAEVVSEGSLLPEFGRVIGKGDAMWRALSICRGEIVCFVDGDTANFGPHMACGPIGPLVLMEGVQFVKGSFQRPFRTGGEVLPDDGGRVTELTARPLLRRFWPELAGVRQPLAGEMAGRRELLCRLPWSTGYAIETALLLDVYATVGLPGIVQVDLDVRQNDHKPLPSLAPMADEVLAAVTVRLQREGRLTVEPGVTVVERPPMERVLRAAA